MWLYNSSIGRKVVMSVSGIALILFLTFHACMNVVALFSADAYNEICEFLGSNWYAVAGTVALVNCHTLYLRGHLDASEPQGTWQQPLRCHGNSGQG